MAVTYTAERAEVASTSNATTYDTGAFTPTPNSLLILAYSGVDNAATFSLSSITEPTGTDLTWTLIRAGTERTDATTYQNWGMYYCLVPSSTTSTTVRLTWSEQLTGACIWIGEFSGHQVVSPIAQSAVTTLASGTETHSLPGAVDPESITVYQNVTLRNPPAWDASGDGWTEEMDTGVNTPAQGMFIAYKANDQTITFTGTDIASGSTIAEIRPLKTDTYSIDTLLFGTIKKTYNLQSYIQQTQKETYDADTLLHADVFVTYDLQSSIFASISKTYDIQSSLKAILIKTHSVDALLSVTTMVSPSYWLPHGLENVGPFIDTNGNLYALLGDIVTTGNIVMMKSTDNGITWAEQDSLNRPDCDDGTPRGDVSGMGAFQLGSTIHVSVMTSNNVVLYNTFRTSDHAAADFWGTIDKVVTTYTDTDFERQTQIIAQSANDLIIFSSGENVSTRERVDYHYSINGGIEWTVKQQWCDQSASFDNNLGPAGIAPDGTIWGSWRRDDSNVFYVKKLETVNGTPGSDIDWWDIAGNHHANNYVGGAPIVGYSDDGVETMVIGGLTAADSRARTSYIIAGSAQATTEVSTRAIRLAGSNSHGSGIAWAVDEETKTVYAVYIDATTRDLWMNWNIDNGGWVGEVQVAGSLNANSVSARVYQRGAEVYLGVLIDEDGPYGDTIFFKKFLRTGSLKKTYSLDSLRKATLTKTHALDSLLKVTSTKAYTMESLLIATLTKTYTLDSLLNATLTKTHALDSLLIATLTDTYDLDSFIGGFFTTTYTLDSLLSATLTKTYTLESLLSATWTKTHALDSLIKATLTVGGTGAATLQLPLLLNMGSGAAGFSQKIDTFLLAKLTKTHSVDSLLKAAIQKTHDIDALLRTILTKSHSVDSLLNKSLTKTHSVDIYKSSTYVFNTFEGGVDEQSITESNSGGASGNAFDYIYGGYDWNYDSARAYSGSFSARAGGTADLRYNASLGTRSQVWGQAYYYVDQGGLDQAFTIEAAGTISGDGGIIKVNTNSKFVLKGYWDFGAGAISSNSYPTNQWFKIDWLFDGTVDGGEITLWFYANASDTIPTEVISTSGTLFDSGLPEDFNEYSTGTGNNAANNHVWMDNVSWWAYPQSHILTKTHSVDTIILKTISYAYSLDSLLSATLVKTHDIDALIGGYTIQTHSVDALLSATLTKTHSADALIKKTFTVGGVVTPLVFRDVATNSNTNQTSIVVNKPTGTVEGDLMVMVVGIFYIERLNLPTFTPPSGWTLQGYADVDDLDEDQNETVDDWWIRVYTKVAGASEPANYTFGASIENGNELDIAVLTYVGAPAGDPMPQIGFNYEFGLADTYIAPTVDGQVGDLLFYINNDGTTVAPSGMTERVGIGGSPLSSAGLFISEEELFAAGATGTRTPVSHTYSKLAGSATVTGNGGGGSYLIDSLLKATLTKTYSFDSLLQATLTKTYALDSLLSATLTKTYALDSLLSATWTKPYALDSLLSATWTKTHSTDSLLSATLTKTHSADALIKKTIKPGKVVPYIVASGSPQVSTGTFAVGLPAGVKEGDLILLLIEMANQSTSDTTDPGVDGTYTKLFGQWNQTASVSVSGAYLYAKVAGAAESNPTITETVTWNHLHVQSFIVRDHGLTSASQVTVGAGNTGTGITATALGITVGIDDLVLIAAFTSEDLDSTTYWSGWTNANLSDITEWADAVTSSFAGGGFGLAVGRALTSSIGDSTVTKESAAWQAVQIGVRAGSGYLLNSLLMSSLIKTHSINSLIKKTFIQTYSLDVLMAIILKLTNNVDVDIKQTISRTHNIDTFIADEEKLVVFLDASLFKAMTQTHSIESLLIQAQAKSHEIDSLLKKTSQKSHDIDILSRKTATISHQLDGLIRKASSVSHLQDSLLSKQTQQSHQVDSLLRKTIQITGQIDALIQYSSNISQFVDGLKTKTQQKSHTIDSLIRQSFISTHLVDALTNKTQSQQHLVDVLLRKTQFQYQLFDALILKAFTKSVDIDSFILSFDKKTYSLDTDIFRTMTSTYLLDAFVLDALTLYSFVDADLKKAMQVAHQIDGLIRKSYYITHDIDILLNKQQQQTHAIDSLTNKTLSSQHDIASLLVTSNQRVHSADALLRKTQIQTHVVDSLVSKAFTQTHSIDSLTTKTKQFAHAVDTHLSKTGTQTHSIDSLLHKTLTVTHEVESLLGSYRTVMQAIDALLRKALQQTHLVDSLILQENRETHLIDVLLQKTQTQTTAIESLIQKAYVVSTQIDSLTQKMQLESHEVDTLLNKTLQAQHSIDALVSTGTVSYHGVDSLLNKTLSNTHLAESMISKAFSAAHQTDSLISKSFSASHNVDTLLNKQTQKSQLVDALVSKSFYVTSSQDALLSKTSTKTYLVDSLINKTNISSHQIDAFLQKTSSTTHVIDSLVSVARSAVHWVASLFTKTESSTHSIDSALIKTQQDVHSADSLLQKSLQVATNIDAQIVDRMSTTTQIDASLVQGTVSTHSLDSITSKIIHVHQFINALKTKTLDKTHVIDSLIIDTSIISHINDSLIIKTQTVSSSAASLIQKAQASTYLLDTYMAEGHTINHAVDVYIVGGGRKTYGVDVAIAIGKTKSHVIDAIIGSYPEVQGQPGAGRGTDIDPQPGHGNDNHRGIDAQSGQEPRGPFIGF